MVNAKDESERRRAFTCKLKPETKAAIVRLANEAGVSQGVYLEELIEREANPAKVTQRLAGFAIPKPGIGKPKPIIQETGEARDARLRHERAADQLSVQDASIAIDDDFVS